MKKLVLLSVVLFLSACTGGNTGNNNGSVRPSIFAPPRADFVLADKSDGRLYLFQGNKVLRSFNVGFGRNPVGHKVQEGDHRTPEGRYMLTYKNAQSSFYKSIRIDYPNEQDIARAAARGVSPGGDIVIHGMPNEVGDYRGPINPRNWTQGCIAVRNYEMDAIWRLVPENTPIEIRP